jgi:peroxiredoxin
MKYASSLFILILGLNLAAQDFPPIDDVKGLAIGSDVENFSALSQYGEEFNLKDALKEGPLVVVFYRGQWCPYCNRHLSALEENLQAIKKKGARVVAVSPEKQEMLMKSAKKTGASFSLLTDDDFNISEAFDLAFLPTSGTRLKYNTILGADLEEAQTDNSERLPIPATYIIGQNGKVLWRHFDRDYSKRANPEEILANLP